MPTGRTHSVAKIPEAGGGTSCTGGPVCGSSIIAATSNASLKWAMKSVPMIGNLTAARKNRHGKRWRPDQTCFCEKKLDQIQLMQKAPKRSYFHKTANF